jgi:serine/threonine protein kinase
MIKYPEVHSVESLHRQNIGFVLKLIKMFKYNKIDEFTNSTIPFVMIQTEYCLGGDLDIFINKNKHVDDLFIRFIDILIESIYILHERGFIH